MLSAFTLYIHIFTGIFSIITGFATLLPEKGSRWHVLLGRVFYYSMIGMTASATYMAAFVSFERINVCIGLFTMFLVITGRGAVASEPPRQAVITVISILFFCAFSLLTIRAVQSEEAIIDGVYVEAFFVFSILSLSILLQDVIKLIRKSETVKGQLARHLWRMLLALFISSTSLFYGQPQLFPNFIKESGVLDILVFLIVASLIFWLLKVRFRWGNFRFH